MEVFCVYVFTYPIHVEPTYSCLLCVVCLPIILSHLCNKKLTTIIPSMMEVCVFYLVFPSDSMLDDGAFLALSHCWALFPHRLGKKEQCGRWKAVEGGG